MELRRRPHLAQRNQYCRFRTLSQPLSKPLSKPLSAMASSMRSTKVATKAATKDFGSELLEGALIAVSHLIVVSLRDPPLG
jgi:hypothetical protein